MEKSIFTEEYNLFLRHIIEARKEADLTQQEVAECLGRPQSFVSKYERGERRLDVVEFIFIAQILGINAPELIKELAETASKSSRMEAQQ